MSEDEDEELAMLRLQALMSKRRGGAGAPRDLPPFPIPLPSLPAEPVPAVVTETLSTISTVIVTSTPASETEAQHDTNTDDGIYQHPHFIHGQARYFNIFNSCDCLNDNLTICVRRATT